MSHLLRFNGAQRPDQVNTGLDRLREAINFPAEDGNFADIHASVYATGSTARTGQPQACVAEVFNAPSYFHAVQYLLHSIQASDTTAYFTGGDLTMRTTA